MTQPKTFRISAEQATPARVKQALMTASNHLGVLIYQQPYQLADPTQHQALVTTLKQDFHLFNDLPSLATTPTVVYLVTVKGTPVVLHEEDALAFVLGVAVALGGRDGADQVTYRPEMLPR